MKKSHLQIKEVYIGPDLNETDAKQLEDQVKEASAFIPNKYKSKIPAITFILRRNKAKDRIIPATMLTSDPVIRIIVRDDIEQQKLEVLHECLHLVELFNKDLMEKTNLFLRSRVKNDKLISLSSFPEFKGLKLNKSDEIMVYSGDFWNRYAGKTYGNLFSGEDIPTEILSVGCCDYVLYPDKFKKEDKDYYSLIKKFIDGRL